MQHRRIIDSTLGACGVSPRCRIEANSISALLSFAQQGWACVVSTSWVELYGMPDGVRAVNLVEPEVARLIGLVIPTSKPVQPLVRALAADVRERTGTAAMDPVRTSA